jgi:hypothetical protein
MVQMRALTFWPVLLVALASWAAQATRPPPVPAGFDLYKETITTPQHLDWLWEDYLVRGHIQAIAKLTTALNLNSYSGALEKAKHIRESRPLTAQEKKAAVMDAVFGAAMWSLESNAKQHPDVLAELTRIESSDRANPDIWHAYLLIILSRADPTRFKVVDKTNGFTFATPTGIVRFRVTASGGVAQQIAPPDSP